MSPRPLVFSILSVVIIFTLACNLGSAVAPAATPVPATPSASAPAAPQASVPPADAGAVVPAAAGSATPPPLVATIMASQHALKPAAAVPGGSPHYDVDSSGTALEHRAPYGDSYNINLFERPFTGAVMNYIPALDITTFALASDADWYYVSFDLSSGDMNDLLGVDYAVELDTDHDGFGDYLVWASPPYAQDWLAETVQVFQDTNHDTGGLSAEKSDAELKSGGDAGLKGDGYDKLVFDRGQGLDPDLAWVRLNPHSSSAIQFAFKRSLAGSAFMWGVWADAGLRDPSRFNYNDRFKESDAGSPEKNEKYYPIQAISQVDDTCWVPQGFKPTGYEPHLCPSNEPAPPKHKAGPTPVNCQNLFDCLPPIIIFWPTPTPIIIK